MRLWMMLAVGAVLTLTACEEMVDNDRESRTARCDADPDWYLNLPIVELRIGGQLNPPSLPTADDPRAVDWSALEAILRRYQGQTFTLARFKQIQRDLFASGLVQDGNQKWGAEFFVRPELPRQGALDL